MTTTPPAITALPAAPDPNDRSTFNARAYPWSAALPAFGTEVSEVGANVKANADEAASSASAAALDAIAAAGSAALAGATAWVSGTTYAVGDARYSPINLQTYRRKIAGAGTTDPSLDSVNWTKAVSVVNTITDDLTTIDGTFTPASYIGPSVTTKVIVLDADRELLLMGGTTSLHAVVYNVTTNTWGAPALIRTGSVSDRHVSTLIAADKVLVCSLPTSTTALQTVVLTTSALAITVGTPVATTLAGNSNLSSTPRLTTVGSSYVLDYGDVSEISCLRAITVSGTTPTIGAESVLTGYRQSFIGYAVSSTVMLAVSTSNTSLQAIPVTVSGTTLTQGTQATTTVTSGNFKVSMQPLSSGRWAVLFANTFWRAGVVTVTGTTATLSQINTAQGYGSGTDFSMYVIGSQALIHKNGWANVLTDTAGTASLGTEITSGVSGIAFGYTATAVLIGSTTGSAVSRVGISGSNPVIEAVYPSTIETTNTAAPLGQLGIGVGGVANNTLRTTTGKHATLDTNKPFGVVTTGAAIATRCNNPGFGGTPAYVNDAVVWAIIPGAGNVINARRIKLT